MLMIYSHFITFLLASPALGCFHFAGSYTNSSGDERFATSILNHLHRDTDARIRFLNTGGEYARCICEVDQKSRYLQRSSVNIEYVRTKITKFPS